jgi:hypothetical protein
MRRGLAGALMGKSRDPEREGEREREREGEREMDRERRVLEDLPLVLGLGPMVSTGLPLTKVTLPGSSSSSPLEEDESSSATVTLIGSSESDVSDPS